MNKISAVIFDCDGVMFDSRQANINYYNHILGHFNLPPMTEDEVSFVHMNTADESVRHIFKGTPYTVQAQEYKKEVDYTPFINDMIIDPELKDLLRGLRPNFSLAVQIEPPWANCISISGPDGAAARAWYQEHNMPLFTWSSLAGGFFSGRFRRDNLDTFDSYGDRLCVTSYCSEENFQRLDRVKVTGSS